MSRKYYWLKLNENFFERDEMKVIENMDNGKDYVIFYLKLLLKSIKTEGELLFNNVIPYNEKMLAAITDTNVDIVRSAIQMFTDLKLIETWDDGTLFMTETQNMIGSETAAAARMRRMRNREKLEEIEDNRNNVTPQLQSVQKSYTEIDIEKEIEIDIEKDSTCSGTLSKKDKELIIEKWNSLGLHQLRTINSNTERHRSLKARIEEYSLKEFLEAIEKIKESDFLQGKVKDWQITFDWLCRPNNFPKVLEGQYSNTGGGENGGARESFVEDEESSIHDKISKLRKESL